MNEQDLIRDIVDGQANKQVKALESDLDALNKKFQDSILGAKQLNDALAQSKGYSEYNKNSAAAAKAQEQQLKLIASRRLQEEKLAAFRASEQTKADARAAKELANEQKLTEAANKRVAQLKANTDKVVAEAERERQAILKVEAARQKKLGVISASTQEDLSNSSSNGVAATTGATVSPQNIAKANTVNAIVSETGAVKQNTVANKENTLSRKQLALMAAQEKANLQANAAALKNQAKELNAAKGSLDQRAAALARLQKVFGALNESERASPFGQRLAKVIPQLNEQVLGLEKTIGKSQRNVGNYINGAYKELQSILQIFPGLGIGTVIGFATQPILEYISTLEVFKVKISEVIKTRKELSSVNLLGAQNAQQEIVELKTLFETAKNAALSDEQRYNAAKKLQELYPKTFENYTIEEIKLGKVGDGYSKLANQIIATARARASQDKIAENSIRQLSNEEVITQAKVEIERLKIVKKRTVDREFEANQNTTNDAKIFASQTKISSVTSKIAEQEKIIREAKRDSQILDTRNLALTENIVKQQLKGAEIAGAPNEKKQKITTAYIDTLRAQIEAERNAQDAIAKDEQKSLDTRLAALNNFINLSERLNELDAAKKIKQGKNVGQARAEQNTEDEKVELEATERKFKINEAAAKNLMDLFKSYSQRELDNENIKNSKIIESTNEVLENIETRRAEAQQKLTEDYANRLISQKEFEAASLRLTNEAGKESLETQIDALQEVIDNEKKFAEFDTSNNKKLARDQRELTNLKIRLSKLGTDARIADLEREIEKQKQVRDSIIDFSKEAFDFTKNLSSSISERRLQNLDEESKAVDKKAKQDIENVNDSIATEKQKADQINIINARQEAKQNEINERIRQQKIKQAKADKAAAIASIIINYAVGYSKNIGILGFLGLPLNAILAATAALQIATVLAQPLPAYKDGKGTGDNYYGPAIVGDGGMKELVVNPDGSMWVTPSTPTLTTVQSGTEVISGPDFKRMLAKPNNTGSHGSNGNIDLSVLVASQNRSTQTIVKALKNQTVNSTILTEKGLFKNKTTTGKISDHISRNFGRR